MALIENRFPNTPVRHLAFDELRPAVAPVAVIDLRDFVAVIKRRRAWIVWPAAACVLVATLFSLAMPARYTANTQILLDPHGLHVMQNDLSARSTASGDTSLAEAESQLQVVTSAGVLTAVVDREKLQTDPEFGEAPPSVLESIAGILVHSAPEDRTLKAVRILQSRVTARRPDKTFVIDVSVWSKDPAKAARIANAIAAVYIDQEGKTKTDAAKRTTAALGSRLAELRERVSQSAHRVEDYKAQHQIVGASGQLVSEQQLSELNNQLGLAHTRTAEQRARYEDIQRLQRNHVEPDAIAEAIQSPAITALRSQYAEAKQAEANASAILGPRHPTVTAAHAQVAQTRRLIEDEVARIARTVRSEYDRAKANEESLQQNLNTMKSDALNTNQALVRMRELEREAESDRAIYAAFLNRTKEVGEQEGVDNTNSRIITRAVPPLDKSGPPRKLIISGSLVLGLIAGLGLALLREQFDPSIYSTRQLSSEFGLPVLAVLPPLDPSPSPVYQPSSREAAAIYRLRDALRERQRGKGARAVLITSPDSAHARSIVALNLALYAGAGGEQVLLVDADREQQAEMISLRSESGEDADKLLSFANRIVRTPWQRVKFLRIFQRGGNEQHMVYGLRDAILSKADKFDLVVIDGGLLLSDPSVQTFAALVDDVVVVVDGGYSRRDRLHDGLEALGSNQAKIAGAVLAG
jgi:uncharacterized protein involved in exopolysaccharide biosynthesis/Mrp family chromosome partitioning ATPase